MEHADRVETETVPSGDPGRQEPGSNGVQDDHYIFASSARTDEGSRVLKRDETFAVADRFGDIRQVGLGDEGLYHEGTRYLSTLRLNLEQFRPLYLSSTIRRDNALLVVDLTNPDIHVGDHLVVPRGTLHIRRVKFLWDGAFYERIHVRNFGLHRIETTLSIDFDADFRDLFEVRGEIRPRRGRRLEPAIPSGDEVILAYEGLDDVTRRTRLTFAPTPNYLSAVEARFRIALEPNADTTIHTTIHCQPNPGNRQCLGYDAALDAAGEAARAARRRSCNITTSNEQFNGWLGRTSADLDMMTTETPHGPYPFAGVPWYSVPFGRDGLITALECLWVNPSMARGVLSYLAATQADASVPAQDAEPGKILHETRKGEMAALKEIPFGSYYGSVDSTPLFVMLAGAYYKRTADLEFLSRIWPHVERALSWIDTYGDRDGDGFVEYYRRSKDGLVQQGWKDSHDSIMHANGQLAEGPIALCEVQGYVYAAKRGAATVAQALEMTERAEELARQAEALRSRFEEAFWCEDLNTYALALDGNKEPCRVRSSNPGHCLWTGIVAPERARLVARTLLSQESFTGFGVRTLAQGEARFNPMSYHNGSVWPHDTAIFAQGLDRYGRKDDALRILTGLFDASIFVDLHRMPELFCGFARRPDEGPTLYPVACAPQSWAAASVYVVLQACLGLEIDAPNSRVHFNRPLLPESLLEVRITNLQVGSGMLDLLLQRFGQNVGINVLRRAGNIEVVSVK